MILITGASGYIGEALLEKIKGDNVIGIRSGNNPGNLPAVNLSNEHEVEALFNEIAPEIIFHFAALASPSVNEINPELAVASHVKSTANILKYLPKNAHLIFLSTDKVFDGSDPNPNEESKTNPLSLYGRLKLECEKMVRERVRNYHILRLPIVHSLGDVRSVSFIDKALINLRVGKQVESFENVARCYVRLEQLVELLTKVQHDDHYGVYHVGTAIASYYDRIRQLCEENQIDWRGRLSPAQGKVVPLRQKLNTDKLRKTFGFSLN